MSRLHDMKKGIMSDHAKWFLDLCRNSKLWREREGKRDVWSKSKQESKRSG